MINGMIAPDQGVVKVRGTSVSSTNPEKLRRSIGYVIQSVGLFPHWTIAQNILAVPKLERWSEAKCTRRLEEIIALLDIDHTLLGRRPKELSGGQQQRIGVARALAADPDIILMDEPFAALDPLSRVSLQAELQKVHKQSGKTIVFVTHDIDEAFKLATQIVLMNKGEIVQTGRPEELLATPANDFVSGFLGGAFARLRLLDRTPVGSIMRPGRGQARIDVGEQESLRTALNLMLVHKVTQLAVVNDKQQRIGEIGIADLANDAL
jgi:osmoprotectant transport system ATP-binding protein